MESIKMETEDPQSTTTPANGKLTVDQLEIEILPVIYDIIRRYAYTQSILGLLTNKNLCSLISFG